MLQVDKVEKSYGGRQLFHSVGFTMQNHERCGLVGRNGSGKTTLFRILQGRETSDKGSIHYPKGYRIGCLDQHVQFQKSTVIDEAALNLSDETLLYQAEKVLFGLGFKESDLQRPPQDFSSGYQLRLQLAKVLIAEPNLLLLDEPTNFLDVVSIRWLERFLQRWKGELLLISHDRQFMDSVCTHIMGIHRQSMLRVKGGTEDYYQRVVQEEEVHERTRINVEKKRAHAEDFIRRFGAKATKAKQAQSRAKALDKMPSLERLAELDHLQFHFASAPFPGRLMLSAKDISFVYPKMHEAPPGGWLIHSVSLEVEKGERLAIIGKNGRGKSTLLRLLAKDLVANEGTILHKDNLKIGYFGQAAIDRLDLTQTVEESIGLANPELNRGEVLSICGLMMFPGDEAKKSLSVLSGGERSRVHLGRLLAQPCNLLLLDEPTNHLDMESIDSLTHALEYFEGSVILVTHDEELLKRIPQRFIICRSGYQESFLGTYEEFLEKQGWEDELELKKEKKTGSRKELKRQRAELVQERARVLNPLKKQLKTVEKSIEALELEVDQLNEELITLSQSQDEAQSMQALLKALAEKKEKLESLYQEWEELGETLAEKEQEFTEP